ncbi:MAG: aldehyde dehydrogenase, partial [Deltaproteobacteria bacterium]|nr:aldehyde dehydrogenase [Deltaproteobacteria bacterium]
MAKFFIASEPRDSESKETTEVRNPATGEVVDTVPKGTVNDIRRAIDAASGALRKWSELAPAKRGAILLEAGRLVLQQEKELARLLTLEQGKPIRESIMEIRRFVHTLDHYGGMAKSLRTGAVVLDHGRHGLILRKPLGVCGAIVPWNFPVSLMGNKLGPALLAGNAVVVKPAGTTPLTDIRCVELIDKAIRDGGGPKGVINVVTGSGSVVGEELLVNPTVRKIGFTGATDTGRRVMQSAAKDFKHVTLELGGSDPMIVCDDADLDRAVSAASVGRFFNCGQACLAIKRLYLFDNIADAFIEKLAEKAKKIRIGSGLKPETLLGPLHTAEQRREVEEQVEDAVKRGAKVVCGAQRPKGDDYDKGFFLSPTLVTDVDPGSRLLQEEVFGPALPIVRVKDLEQAIEQANNSIFGLGSSVWTRDLNRAMVAAEQIEAGYTWINSA